LENVDDNVDINRSWGTITENIKISAKESLSYYEIKNYKPWFDEECTVLLDQRKEANLHWLQDPRKRNGIILMI
jgi:hypothetical protein